LSIVAAVNAGAMDHLPAWLDFVRHPMVKGADGKEVVAAWIKVACALTMAAGTAGGGWRIIKTMGQKMVKVLPVNGFAADFTAASILMIVTVQDPPRFDWRSVLVLWGFGLSVLGLLRVPFARRLPLGVAVFCVAGVAGGIVARGSAYPGRFSVHLIPVAVAMAMLSAVAVQEVMGWRLTS